MDWVTNNAKAAKRLRSIDTAYDKDREAAKHLTLENKVDALRAAKHRRDSARAEFLTNLTID